jgi:glycosyltransferase involved in cell wall biosynthesis
VLLESMACGTPVLATRVWGTPEVVRDPRAGRLTERDSQAIGDHIRQLLTSRLDRDQVRAYACEFSWDETSDRLHQLYSEVLAES